MDKIIANWSAQTRKVSLTLRVIFLKLSKMSTLIVLLLVLVVVAVAVALLVGLIYMTKDKRFPNTHIHDNPEMRKRGITCARDKECYN